MMLSKLLKFLTPSVISVLQAIGDIFKILLFTAIQTIEISIHTKIIKAEFNLQMQQNSD